MKISIQIVTLNSLNFIDQCFKSIEQQSFKDFITVIVDNGSTDGTTEFIRKNWPKVYLIANRENLGFSGAHNQAIRINKDTDYILVSNPDIVLEKDFLEELLKTIERNKKIGSVSGKLLKMRIADYELKIFEKTKIIDSTGLKIYRSRRVADRGEGEKDMGQFDQTEEVFGFSGACVLYRREALEDVKIPKMDLVRLRPRQTRTTAGAQFSNQIKDLEKIGEYFDEVFFAYKEDIDLSWRLKLRDWKAVYQPKAVAFHIRAVFGQEKASWLERFKMAKKKLPLIHFLSYRNHLFVLLKNDHFINFLFHLPFIFYEQIKKEFFLLFFQPAILFKGSLSFWQNCLKMYRKRRYIMKKAKIRAKEMRRWIQ